MLFAPERFQFVADDHALRQEERESRTFIGQHEQIHFLANLTVVTLLGFFHLCNIFVQLFLTWESRCVNSLQHLPVGVASPVCTCHAHQLVSLDLSGGFHMRSCTQIHEVALLVEGNHGVLRQILNQFHLIRFVLLFHKFDGFFSRQFKSFQRIVCLYDLLHFLLDLREIFFAELMLRLKIIVEAVIDCRADGQLGIRPQTLYSLRHDMGGRMSVIMSHLFIFPV